MDQDDQECLLDLFIQPGWKMVMDEMKEALRQMIETTHLLEAEHELWKRKGEIQQLSQFINYENLVKAQINETLKYESLE